MSDRCSNSGFAFFSGIIVGAAIGAITGLLMAPEPGEETRKKVSDKTKEIQDDLLDRFDDLKDNVNEILDEVKDKGSQIINDVKKPLAKESKA